MPPFDASAVQTLPDLGRVLVSWFEHADLCEVLRKRAQVVGLRAQLGLPRRSTGETTSRWLSSMHAVCELGSRERFGARVFCLALPVDQAAALLDRVLGGSGQAGVASAAGTLSDAECGVLAHLAAQACAACGAALSVRDVFCADAEKLRGLCAEGALWPLRIGAELAQADGASRAPRGASSEGASELTFDAKLLFGAAADCPAGRYPLALSLPDTIALETLKALEVGDLLASDAWSLTLTSRGLEGVLVLSASGVAESAGATLCGPRVAGLAGRARRLEAASGSQAAATGRDASPALPAELRLYEIALGFWELAELAAGGAIDLPAPGPRAATLYVAGQPLASGGLVRMHGAIALRVEALLNATRSDSAASSASPRASDPG
jgi:hypothetical protein